MVDFTTASTASEVSRGPVDSDRQPQAQVRVPESPPTPGVPERLTSSRALWMLVGIGLLWWSWQLIGASAMAWTVPFLVICNIVGLLVVLVSWLPEGIWAADSRFVIGVEWAAAILTIAVFVIWGISASGGMSPYGTDAMAFDQYAAQLAQHGLNPYVHSMAPAFGLFRTPTSFYTYAFNGHPVTALSYPSLSFLVYVPFLALGWSQNLAPIVNVLAWGLTVGMMFKMVPRDLRAVTLLLGGFGLYAAFAIGGVTDVLFMPLLLVSAYKWDRFGASRSTYIGPICFGLAMGIKQNPWPALPFLLLALCLDEQARTGLSEGVKRAGRYLAAVMAAFLIPNIPYFVASPSGWIHGVLTPLFADMVPTGQGTISLTLYLHMGGGSVTAFTLAAALMLVLSVVAFIGTYPLLRAGAFVLPALAFFFDDRSNVNYFISLIPIGFVAAATVKQAPFQARQRLEMLVSHGRGLRETATRILSSATWFRSPRWAGAAVGLGVLFVAATAYSLTAPAPLRIRLTSVMTTGTTSKIEQMTLRVTNLTDHSVQPAFDVIRGGYNSTFWHRKSGPKTIAAGHTVTYLLTAPNWTAEPSIYGGFNVVGYVESPKSFAVSPSYRPRLYHIGFIPDAINREVGLGQPLNVTVQVYNTSGAALHRAGIRVRMTQIIWAAAGPHKSRVKIGDSPRGKAGVAYTNSQGIATFRVVSQYPTVYPVTFNATLKTTGKGPKLDYVYSDSGALNLRFGGS
jgi:hypothetical protein